MQLPQEIYDIAEHIKNAVPVEKIYLFGSYAYGAPTKDSDYDFYLVFPDSKTLPMDSLISARLALPDDYKKPIDVIGNYSSDFYRRKNNFRLEKKIYNEGVVVYEGA